MKQLFLLIVAFAFLPSKSSGQNLSLKLQKIFGSENVIAIDSSGFLEYYKVKCTQQVNHNNADSGTFKQQVLIGIRNINATNVFLTEGYNIPNIHKDPTYQLELTTLLKANQIVVEHRYFGESIPDSTSKKYLTYKQASDDFHYIKEQLANILSGKWITTGVSKSGDAALAYRFYYPKDVAATVVFGISLTTAAEDSRFKTFLAEKRKTDVGKIMTQGQLHLLKNKKTLLPIFKMILDSEHQDYSSWDLETLYDFGVLDLETSFWQNYSSFDDMKLEISEIIASDPNSPAYREVDNLPTFEDKLVFFAAYNAISTFQKNMQSHFYQAFSQGGYYGYDETPFLPYFKQKDYSLSIFAGEQTTFDSTFRNAEKKWTENEMEHVIFINGSNDPWAVCKIIPSKKRDNVQILARDANHNLKLKNLDSADFDQVKQKIQKWLMIKF